MPTLNAFRTAQVTELDWRFTELVTQSWNSPEFTPSLEDLDGMLIDDLDHPAAFSAAYSFCG